MNIEVKRSALLHALAAADGIARTGATMPLLECVLITAIGKSAITVAATDLTMTIRAELESSNTKEGSIAISAKRLRDVAKGAPDETIRIVTLENGWIDVKCGRAHYKLAAVAGRDFPKVPEPTKGKGKRITFQADTIKTLIDRVLFSASDDKTRMQLNGALFDVHAGSASMTSTDGHRLTRATAEAPHDADDMTATIPKDALAKIARIVEDEVEIIVEASRIFVRTAGLVMSSPLVDGQFPPVAALLAFNHDQSIVVSRTDLIASIERTRIATTDVHGTEIDARTGTLTLSSSHPDVGEVSDDIEADGPATRAESCVAPKYLLEPLARMTDDRVRIRLSSKDPLERVIIEPADASNYLAIVMPMRR